MKKEYKRPLIENYLFSTEHPLAAGSTSFNTGDLPPIENGGDANDGEGSDARRNYNVWDDELDDEEEDY